MLVERLGWGSPAESLAWSALSASDEGSVMARPDGDQDDALSSNEVMIRTQESTP